MAFDNVMLLVICTIVVSAGDCCRNPHQDDVGGLSSEYKTTSHVLFLFPIRALQTKNVLMITYYCQKWVIRLMGVEKPCKQGNKQIWEKKNYLFLLLCKGMYEGLVRSCHRPGPIPVSHGHAAVCAPVCETVHTRRHPVSRPPRTRPRPHVLANRRPCRHPTRTRGLYVAGRVFPVPLHVPRLRHLVPPRPGVQDGGDAAASRLVPMAGRKDPRV
jgi:hypothetical protein